MQETGRAMDSQLVSKYIHVNNTINIYCWWLTYHVPGMMLSPLPGLYQSFLQPSEVTGTCWLVGCATAPLVSPALPHFQLRKEGSLPVTSHPNFKQPTQTFRSHECLEPALALRNRCANFPANTLRTKCTCYVFLIHPNFISKDIIFYLKEDFLCCVFILHGAFWSWQFS